MSKIKTLFLTIVWIVLLVPGMPAYVGGKENQKTIAIILSDESSMHDAAVSTLIENVAKNSSTKVNFRYLYNNDISAIKTLKNIDYVISIGAASAKAILSSKPEYPVLFTLIPKQTLDNLIEGYGPKRKNYYVIYLTQPMKRKLRLSEIILDKPGRVGAAFSSRESKLAEDFLSESAPLALDLKIKYFTDYSKPIDAMSDALSESDIYVAMYDASLLNKYTAKWLLYMAYKMNKPLIGFSNAYTKAGAVASVYSTPEQIGMQTGEWIAHMLDNKPIEKYQYPKYFTVSVNERMQRILRLKKLPAEKIESLLLSMEKGGRK